MRRTYIGLMGAAIAASLAAGFAGNVPVRGPATVVTPSPMQAPTPGGISGGGSAAVRRNQAIGTAMGTSRVSYRNWPPRTVAQDKRDARKRRNRLRHKRHMRG